MTNQQAYDQASDIMKKVFQTTRLEDLICLNVTMPSSRSFCHIDLIHKDADFLPWENDKWTAFLRITNSYNRTRLLRFEPGFCRWICLNGMIKALNIVIRTLGMALIVFTVMSITSETFEDWNFSSPKDFINYSVTMSRSLL